LTILLIVLCTAKSLKMRLRYDKNDIYIPIPNTITALAVSLLSHTEMCWFLFFMLLCQYNNLQNKSLQTWSECKIPPSEVIAAHFFKGLAIVDQCQSIYTI